MAWVDAEKIMKKALLRENTNLHEKELKQVSISSSIAQLQPDLEFDTDTWQRR